jgi:hypothetical protein
VDSTRDGSDGDTTGAGTVRAGGLTRSAGTGVRGGPGTIRVNRLGDVVFSTVASATSPNTTPVTTAR